MTPDDLKVMTDMARLCTDFMRQMMAMGPGMMRGGMMGGFMPVMWWGLLQALVFWGLLVGVIAAVIVLLLRRRNGPPAALAVLHLRLAKGEISVEEYEQRRRLLQS